MYTTAMIEVPAMLSVAEAAKVYPKGLGRNLIYTAIAKGELRCYRPNGRDFMISAEDLIAWIKSKEFKTKVSK